MLYAKFGCIEFSGSREDAKNVQKITTDEQCTTNDDGQKQIAIHVGHLSNSSFSFDD